MSKTAAIIVAAGEGHRMGTSIAKQYLPIFSVPIIVHTLNFFENCAQIDEIILVVKKDEVEKNRQEIVQQYGFKKIKSVVGGGHEQQNSVFNGLKALLPGGQLVVVHDGVRPLLTETELDKVLEAGKLFGAATLATPVKETIKEVDREGLVVKTLNRDNLWSIQTPQVFHWDILWPAMQKAMVCGFSANDEAGIVEWDGNKVKIVQGNYDNIKITTPDDLERARLIMERRKNESRNRV